MVITRLHLVFGSFHDDFAGMKKAFLPLIFCISWCAGAVRASEDIAEKSDVVVPDGIFGTMRTVDSETLILPDASAVMRRQQQRTAAQESRERAAQRAEAERLSNAARIQAAAPAPATETNPESALVEESAQAAASVKEPSVAVADPAPATPEPEPEPPAEPGPTPAEESVSGQE